MKNNCWSTNKVRAKELGKVFFLNSGYVKSKTFKDLMQNHPNMIHEEESYSADLAEVELRVSLFF